MRCCEPECFGDTAVIDSRMQKKTGTVRRRRACRVCERRFTTYEYGSDALTDLVNDRVNRLSTKAALDFADGIIELVQHMEREQLESIIAAMPDIIEI